MKILLLFLLSTPIFASEFHPAFPSPQNETIKLPDILGFKTFFVETNSSNEQYEDFKESEIQILAWLGEVISQINSFNEKAGLGTPLTDLKFSSEKTIIKSILIRGGDSEANLYFEEGFKDDMQWKSLVLNYEYLKELFLNNDRFMIIHEYGHGVFPDWLSDNYFGESLADLYAISVLGGTVTSIVKSQNYISPIDFYTFCESDQYIRNFKSNYNYIEFFRYDTTFSNYGVGLIPHEATCSFNTHILSVLGNQTLTDIVNKLYEMQKTGGLQSIPFVPNTLFKSLNLVPYKMSKLKSTKVNYTGSYKKIEDDEYISIGHDFESSHNVILELKIKGKIQKLPPINYIEDQTFFYIPHSSEHDSSSKSEICPGDPLEVRSNYLNADNKITTTDWSSLQIMNLEECFSFNEFGSPFIYDF